MYKINQKQLQYLLNFIGNNVIWAQAQPAMKILEDIAKTGPNKNNLPNAHPPKKIKSKKKNV